MVCLGLLGELDLQHATHRVARSPCESGHDSGYELMLFRRGLLEVAQSVSHELPQP